MGMSTQLTYPNEVGVDFRYNSVPLSSQRITSSKQGEKVMANKECPWGGCDDVVSKTLCRIGVTRSMLWTLALVPFAWNGVVWVGQALQSLWGLVTNAVG